MLVLRTNCGLSTDSYLPRGPQDNDHRCATEYKVSVWPGSWENNCEIDYRDITGALLRNTGVSARYRYRETLFPSPVCHRALENQ